AGRLERQAAIGAGGGRPSGRQRLSTEGGKRDDEQRCGERQLATPGAVHGGLRVRNGWVGGLERMNVCPGLRRRYRGGFAAQPQYCWDARNGRLAVQKPAEINR